MFSSIVDSLFIYELKRPLSDIFCVYETFQITNNKLFISFGTLCELMKVALSLRDYSKDIKL